MFIDAHMEGYRNNVKTMLDDGKVWVCGYIIAYRVLLSGEVASVSNAYRGFSR